MTRYPPPSGLLQGYRAVTLRECHRPPVCNESFTNGMVHRLNLSPQSTQNRRVLAGCSRRIVPTQHSGNSATRRVVHSTNEARNVVKKRANEP